jgi:lipoprotein-anchoring transpeptidase ErfK/SrfK
MKILLGLIFVSAFLPYTAIAQVDLSDLLSPTEMAQEFNIDVNAGSDFTDFSVMNTVHLQIVVHKAPVAENLEVILDGTTLYIWPTSTGRNQWETSPSGEHYFTETKEGTFRIFKMVENYWSVQWRAPMSDAMFFDAGNAIHGTTPDHYSQLGTPASGGCVRLDQANAATLWALVRKTGANHTLVIVTSH